MDVSGQGSYEWTINVPNDTLAKTNKYCVAFAGKEYSYTYDGYNIFSPGFLIRNRPTPTPTPEAASSSGLQTGAKVGIGVGVGVGGLAVFSALGFLLLRRRRQYQASSQAIAASPGSEQAQGKGYYQEQVPDHGDYQGQMWNKGYYSAGPEPQELYVPLTDSLSEAPSTSTPPVELPSVPREK